MTQNPESGARSMRYTIDEVLSGMLASIERDSFTDDSQRLGEVFKGLAHEAPLFASFGALASGPERAGSATAPAPSGFADGRGSARWHTAPGSRGPMSSPLAWSIQASSAEPLLAPRLRSTLQANAL